MALLVPLLPDGKRRHGKVQLRNAQIVAGMRHRHRHRQAVRYAEPDWAITGVDYNAEDDIARLFHNHQLPTPRVLVRARSAMSVMVSLAHTDLLAMLQVQWEAIP